MNLPTVVVAFLVRNKEHTLPYFLGCLEKLAYPKSKLTLFIRSDHNVDKSVGMCVILWHFSVLVELLSKEDLRI